MTIKSMLECESKGFEKIKKIQLPHYFKRIGAWIFVLSFSFLFINKFFIHTEVYSTISKYSILVGLLIIAISKEKIEDELIIFLRMQSFTMAFIVSVLYALIMPFVDYFVDLIFNMNKAIVKDMGDFVILFFLLITQVFYFEYLKRLQK